MNWLDLLRSHLSSGLANSSRRREARRRTSCRSFEALEQRTLLAGDVTATLIGQTAFIDGDSNANDVLVSVVDGNVVITGLTDTTINGSSEAFVLAEGSTEFSGSIIARMGAGADRFELSEASVSGRLHVFGGSGSDILTTSNSASVGGSLRMKGQSGSDQMAVSNTTVGGSVRMKAGRGDDLMAIADSTIAGRFIVSGGRGADDVVISDSTISKDVWMTLGSGSDDVVIADSTVSKRLVVFGGRGSEVIYTDNATLGRGAVMVLGSGRDRVSVQGESDFSGRTVIAGGRKSDVVEVADTAAVSKLRRFSIKSGTVEADTIADRITGPGGAISAAAAFTQGTTALQLSLSNSVVSEADGNAASLLTITRTAASSAALDVTIESSLPARLQPASTVVTIPAGSTSVTVDLNAIDDATSNGEATVVLTATADGAESQAIQITVIDDESTALSLTAAATRVTEDSDGLAETVSVTARRTGDISNAETIDLTYELSDGSSAASALTGPATAEFPAGTDSVTFDVTTVPNTSVGDDVSVAIIASNDSDTAQANLLVEDNDKNRLTVRFDTLSVVEDGPPATITVSRTSDTTSALDVTLETSDVSRIAFDGQSILALVIPAGATSITQEVLAVDDDLVNGNQSVTITATAVDLETGINSLEVTDNDTLALTLTVAGSSTIAEDAGSDAATVTLRRNSEDVSDALEVTLTQTGDARLSGPTTVTIPAGDASVNFTIDALDNDVVDTPATGTTTWTATATDYPDASLDLTVTNDDTATTNFNPSSIVVSEAQGTAQMTLERNNSTGAETVALTYSDSSLVSGPASVEFADGETTLTFTATITDNDSFDNNQTVTINGTVTGQPEIVLNVDVANDDLLAVSTNFSSNTTEQTVGGLVTKESTFTVTGATEPGATVAIDSDADGEFDDGTTTADSSGNYTVDVTLLHNDTNVGVNRIQAQATLAAAPAPVTSESTFVHLAIGTVTRFQTNQDLDEDGTNDFFDVELFDVDAPNTVANFLQYVQDGTYENNIIHRSIADFVIQGGGFDLTSTGVEAVTTRTPIADEFSAQNSNVRGTLSMAHAGPNTGTSQWFVNTGDNLFLDDVPHTVFGRVIGNGMGVVDAINQNFPVVDFSLQPNLGAFASVPVTNFPYDPLTGTVSVVANSTTLTGSGTLFTSELQVGDIIAVSANTDDALPALRVVSINSDTELTVDVQGDADATGRTFGRQTDPVLEDFILFNNIGEILDSI